MTRISLMNLMMHGITSPNIDQKNTLSKRYDESNYYDVVLANHWMRMLSNPIVSHDIDPPSDITLN